MSAFFLVPSMIVMVMVIMTTRLVSLNKDHKEEEKCQDLQSVHDHGYATTMDNVVKVKSSLGLKDAIVAA